MLSICRGQILCGDSLDEIIPTIDKINSDRRDRIGKLASENYRKDIVQYLFDENKISIDVCIRYLNSFPGGIIYGSTKLSDNDRKDMIQFLTTLKG